MSDKWFLGFLVTVIVALNIFIFSNVFAQDHAPRPTAKFQTEKSKCAVKGGSVTLIYDINGNVSGFFCLRP